MKKGGHFAALDIPVLWTKEARYFLKPVNHSQAPSGDGKVVLQPICHWFTSCSAFEISRQGDTPA
jgi:hypothetical protein